MLCIFLLITLIIYTNEVGSKTIFVDDNTEKDYNSIQRAIENASSGDTIFVYSGGYLENILINKKINLIGENKNTTIIDGDYNGDVIKITADGVKIQGFKIQSSGTDVNSYGINILSDDNEIYDNKITSNANGIRIYSSSGNFLENNSIFYNYYSGLFVNFSNKNIVKNNLVSDNIHNGILMVGGENNSFVGNNISSNSNYGFFSEYNSKNNIFYHNNFFDNISKIVDNGSNTWFNSELKKGNFWSDYLDRYPNSEDKNSDGIWDTAYEISGDNKDEYPLVENYPNSEKEIIENGGNKKANETPGFVFLLTVFAITFYVVFLKKKRKK